MSGLQLQLGNIRRLDHLLGVDRYAVFHDWRRLFHGSSQIETIASWRITASTPPYLNLLCGLGSCNAIVPARYARMKRLKRHFVKQGIPAAGPRRTSRRSYPGQAFMLGTRSRHPDRIYVREADK